MPSYLVHLLRALGVVALFGALGPLLGVATALLYLTLAPGGGISDPPPLSAVLGYGLLFGYLFGGPFAVATGAIYAAGAILLRRAGVVAAAVAALLGQTVGVYVWFGPPLGRTGAHFGWIDADVLIAYGVLGQVAAQICAALSRRLLLAPSAAWNGSEKAHDCADN